MGRWFLRGWRFRPAHHPPHTFIRLGAFTDGVFAIAATLLVLELRLPEDIPPGGLGEALLELDAEYAAYAIGFLQIGVGWLQSRRLEAWVRGVDHYGTLLILLNLAIFSLTPFSISALARAFSDSADPADLASAVRLTALLIFLATLLWSATLLYVGRCGLLRDDLDPDVFTLYFRLNSIVWLVPAAAWLLSYAAPRAALVLLVSLLLLALLPNEAHPVEQPTSRMSRSG